MRRKQLWKRRQCNRHKVHIIIRRIMMFRGHMTKSAHNLTCYCIDSLIHYQLYIFVSVWILYGTLLMLDVSCNWTSVHYNVFKIFLYLYGFFMLPFLCWMFPVTELVFITMSSKVLHLFVTFYIAIPLLCRKCFSIFLGYWMNIFGYLFGLFLIAGR